MNIHGWCLERERTFRSANPQADVPLHGPHGSSSQRNTATLPALKPVPVTVKVGWEPETDETAPVAVASAVTVAAQTKPDQTDKDEDADETINVNMLFQKYVKDAQPGITCDASPSQQPKHPDDGAAKLPASSQAVAKKAKNVQKAQVRKGARGKSPMWGLPCKEGLMKMFNMHPIKPMTSTPMSPTTATMRTADQADQQLPAPSVSAEPAPAVCGPCMEQPDVADASVGVTLVDDDDAAAPRSNDSHRGTEVTKVASPCKKPGAGDQKRVPGVANSLAEGLSFTEYYLDQLQQMPADMLPGDYESALELIADRMDSMHETDSTSFSGVEAPMCCRRLLHRSLQQRLGRRIRCPSRGLLHMVEWDHHCQMELLSLDGDDSCLFGDISCFFRDELKGLIDGLKKNPALALETLAPLLEQNKLVKRTAFCLRHQ